MKKNRLYVGFDCHAESHYCVIIDGEGKLKMSFEVLNTKVELNNCAQEFKNLQSEYDLTIGVEGSRNFGLHLAKRLSEENFEILEVCSNLTRTRRRTTWGSGKSDEVDALIIARTVRDEHERLSSLSYTANTESIIKLIGRREDLVDARSVELRRLHSLLLELNPEYKQKGNILLKSVRNYWMSYCKRKLVKENDELIRVRLECICSVLYSILFLNQSIEALEKRLDGLKTLEVKILMSVTGIGLISACRLVAKIGNIERFENASKLAAYAGLSPVTFASGRFSKARCNIRGNRKLNSILYAVALTAATNDEISKSYYEKKLEEGKTKKQALRYLARRMVKLIYSLLKAKEFYCREYYVKSKQLCKTA